LLEPAFKLKLIIDSTS